MWASTFAALAAQGRSSAAAVARKSVILRVRELVSILFGSPGERGSGERISSVFLPSFVRAHTEGGRREGFPMSSIEHVPAGVAAGEISAATVRLLHEYTGRGPTRARTHIDEHLITVVLQDTLTMGERSLIDDGKTELVLATRRAFQETMSSQMINAVEQHSGRKVSAFLSANHVDPDIAIESFVLEPSSAGEASNGTADSA